MEIFFGYSLAGLAAYFLIRLLHKKFGASTTALDFVWTSVFSDFATFLIAVVFWPIVLGLSFLCLLASRGTASTNKLRITPPIEMPSDLKPISRLSFAELAAAQKRALNELETHLRDARKKMD